MLDRLLLVRHGEVLNLDHVVYADLPGFALSDVGVAQARAVARHLGGTEVHHVLSSPVRRAVETAQPIAVSVGCPVIADTRLTEWRLSSRWAPTRWEDLTSAFPGELEAYLATPAELPFAPESIAEVAARMEAAIADAGRRSPGGTAVVVSHQDPIQAIRLMLSGRPLSELNDDKPTHASVIDLRRRGTRWGEDSVWAPEIPGGAPFPPDHGAPQGSHPDPAVP